MNPKQSIMNRMPISEAKDAIMQFLKKQTRMHISMNGAGEFPLVDVLEYRYVDEEQIIIVTPNSVLRHELVDQVALSCMIYDEQWSGAKTTRRIYGKYTGEELALDDDRLASLAKEDMLVKRMLTHGARFFKLAVLEATAYLSGSELFTLDHDMQVSFAKYTLTGRERFENSRHIMMRYEGRDVIFNAIVEDGIYYTLTKADSNKMAHILQGGICQVFDGKERHFETQITVLEDRKVEEVFAKLAATNNNYFKTTESLKALAIDGNGKVHNPHL